MLSCYCHVSILHPYIFFRRLREPVYTMSRFLYVNSVFLTAAVSFQGGPCGVLAAVQAFVLKHLLFGGKRGDTKKYNYIFKMCVYLVMRYSIQCKAYHETVKGYPRYIFKTKGRTRRTITLIDY